MNNKEINNLVNLLLENIEDKFYLSNKGYIIFNLEDIETAMEDDYNIQDYNKIRRILIHQLLKNYDIYEKDFPFNGYNIGLFANQLAILKK